MPRKLWTPLAAIREAERAEIRAGLKIARRQARRERWMRWEAWWTNLSKRLKVAATIIASAAGIGSGLPPAWRVAKKVWGVMRAGRDVGPAELPKTGQPTIGTDFVDKPTSPKQ